MSNKRIFDPLLVDLTKHCSRFDRLSNDIHAALRNRRELDLDLPALLDEVAHAAAACAEVIKDPAIRKAGLDGPTRAVSFTLRAAHEVLEAAIALSSAPAMSASGTPGAAAPTG